MTAKPTRESTGPIEVIAPATVFTTTYRGTSLIRNSPFVGPYSRTMPRALWWP